MNSPETHISDRGQTLDRVRSGLKKRYARERRFRLMGFSAVMLGLLFLVFFFGSIVSRGYTSFVQTNLLLNVSFDEKTIDPKGERDPEAMSRANYRTVVRNALMSDLGEVKGRKARKAILGLASNSAVFKLRDEILADNSLIGSQKSVWVLADDEVDLYIKSGESAENYTGRLSPEQIGWIDTLRDSGQLKLKFNTAFFTNGDSREPEQAGVLGAALGSFYMLLITLLVAFPVGVASSIYLEEFAPTNKFTDLIEVNINNLAAVPSIVFGLLGLAVFINFFELPRSAPLVGGLVLSLMTLPVVIIAGRAAIKSVPPSIREAALGLGASHTQVVFHHVLPLAMPGMLTGTIIGMARALGESAPLLMIGMVAFIVDKPTGPMDSATALPVQIFLWFDIPERAFIERTSGAIIVLLLFLLAMNGTAVWLRKKFERRW
ncbi:MAG: phosphate ABC transporter permease PstA [Gammaproteobacteria bacterium]